MLINLEDFLPDDQDINVSIIEEAAAIQTVCTMEQLRSQGQSTSMESVAVVMLADLQDEQDREIAMTLRGIENMVSPSLILFFNFFCSWMELLMF